MDGLHQFNVGAFRCTVIADEEWQRQDVFSLGFVNATPDEEAAAIQAYINATGDRADTGSMNVLHVDTGAHRVLIDTGNGGELLGRLDAAGIERASIDTVIITHAHGDHILGNTDGQGNPTFPNARYVISAPEWEYWTANPEDDHRANLLAIADRFERIPMDAEIVPGIRAIPASGHTPGMLALLIESNGERLLHIADAYHHPVELPKPEWYFTFDSDPEQTVRTRRELLDLAAREGLLVLTYHFGFPGTGRVRAGGDVWQWERVTP